MIGITTRVVTAAALLASCTAFAGESGSATGRYAIHTTSAERNNLPDGSGVELTHYRQTIFAEQGEHPIDNTSAECIGMFRLSAEGALTSGSGACYSRTAGGDGASFWWRMEEAGTESCPTICGVWGFFDGYGEFAGIQGDGWWKQITVFPDGSIGAWGGSYSVE